MNRVTTQQLDQQVLMHEIAIECLRLKRVCLTKGDQWGAGFWGNIYSNIVSDINDGKVCSIKTTPMTEEQYNAAIDEIFATDTADYILRSEVLVSADGKLSFTNVNGE